MTQFWITSHTGQCLTTVCHCKLMARIRDLSEGRSNASTTARRCWAQLYKSIILIFPPVFFSSQISSWFSEFWTPNKPKIKLLFYRFARGWFLTEYTVRPSIYIYTPTFKCMTIVETPYWLNKKATRATSLSTCIAARMRVATPP